MPGFFPPISLLNISVYRLQPRLFIDSLPYLKKNQRTIKSYGSAARLDQALNSKVNGIFLSKTLNVLQSLKCICWSTKC
jgi:hypothetical protein